MWGGGHGTEHTVIIVTADRRGGSVTSVSGIRYVLRYLGKLSCDTILCVVVTYCDIAGQCADINGLLRPCW